jgi:hypothetical protein
MRFLFPLASLIIAIFSLAMDRARPAPASFACLHGGCGPDQILAGLDTSGDAQAAIAALLVEDPANPAVWATYGEFLSARGQTGKAAEALDQALALGPGISPTLMRAANFDFTHDRSDQGLHLATRILSQTSAYDEIVFSYLQSTHAPILGLFSRVIPTTPRVAHSWLGWIRAHGSTQDIVDTWSWMLQNHFVDEKSATDVASSLWEHKDYRRSQQIWADWLGAKRGNYLHPQRLANRRFEQAPNQSPFDWKLEPPPSIQLVRQDGLEVFFSGKENVTSLGLRQFATAEAGRYRFSAEVKADGLTTDEGPYWGIADAENPARLNVETQALRGSSERSRMNLDFTVPAATQILDIRLLRRSSLRFDNAIAGTLHIYEVSLVPLHRE